MNMRILIVTDFYPPFIGGSERQAQLLGRALARRGHECSVATIWGPGLQEQQVDEGVPIHRLKGLSTCVSWFSKDPKRRFHPPFPDPIVVLALRRLLQQFRPDLVHSYGWITYSCAVALLGMRIPLLISARDYRYSCAVTTMLRQGQLCSGPAFKKCLHCATAHYGTPKGIAAVAGVFSGRLLLRRAIDGLHSNSTYVRQMTWRDLLRQYSTRKGTQARHIPDVVIPSFRETPSDAQSDTLPQLQRYLERLPSVPYLLFVGALQPHKGLQVLLAAYARLEAPPPLVLIGSVWPETPRTFPAGVTVIGPAPHAVVMAAWQNCLFGVAPSLWPEPFGTVIHEAMSKGKAIIGTTPGGHADIILDGTTGLLVPAGDLEALAHAMKRLIDDVELRSQLGQAAQEHAQRFTADAVIPRFEHLYRQIIHKLPGASDENSVVPLV
jgi:glycosyltransferase involved in cell wall biosynthesis